jgi:hypothetical protein
MGVKFKKRKYDKMNKTIKALREAKMKVAQTNPELGNEINTMLNDVSPEGMNPNIETYAKPKYNVNPTNESSDGLVHSFSVEIKALKNGPIPDTQLMSKILQAIENHSTAQFAEGMEDDGNEFEVVSFKYERREDKKSAK